MGQAKLEVLLDRRSDSLWSWVVCVASFFLQFLVGGISNSFGSFFIALLSEYKRSEAETAWIGSLAVGLTYLCGPISTTLCHRLGCRIVACTGSLLFLIAAFLTSLVSNMTYMYLTFGILGGFAFSLMYFASLVVLIEYFNRHLSLANGIAVSGSGAGTLVISMIVDEMCRRYGLRAGFRFIAGMSFLGFIAGLSFAPLSKHPMEPLIEKDDVKPKKGGFGKSIGSFLRPGKHWKNKAFVVWTLCLALVLFAYYIPYMYLFTLSDHKRPLSGSEFSMPLKRLTWKPKNHLALTNGSVMV